MSRSFSIGRTPVGGDSPVFFVADIGANHDGSLDRAKELIKLAADAGANAAKFQNFKASTIVSDLGFRQLNNLNSHQSSWTKSVYDVYDSASISLEWTQALCDTCSNCGIEYFTSPYDLGILTELSQFTSAWKIGSGDITWTDLIRQVSTLDLPVLIATGASDLSEVLSAMEIILPLTEQVVLMQCNTNYTASVDNYSYIHLNVLREYSRLFPQVVLGLSDHTPDSVSVLGAIALGAKVIEKHFTDDNSRIGPDHRFAMNPNTWAEMVSQSRRLELCLGSSIKRVEPNEAETVVLQRRSLRAVTDLTAGHVIVPSDFIPLRPCPEDALSPADHFSLIGRTLNSNISSGDYIRKDDHRIR